MLIIEELMYNYIPKVNRNSENLAEGIPLFMTLTDC